MEFFVTRTDGCLTVSRIINVYNGAFRIENSLGENIFKYNDSWNNLSDRDLEIYKAEYVVSKLPNTRVKRLTENIILNKIYRLQSKYDSDYTNFYFEHRIHLVYKDFESRTILQTVDIPIEKLIYDRNSLTKGNYIIQLSLLRLNN